MALHTTTHGAAIAHYYRQERARQLSIAAQGGGSLTVYESGRTERSYGSAAYGEHAASALAYAKRHHAFLNRMRSGAF